MSMKIIDISYIRGSHFKVLCFSVPYFLFLISLFFPYFCTPNFSRKAQQVSRLFETASRV